MHIILCQCGQKYYTKENPEILDYGQAYRCQHIECRKPLRSNSILKPVYRLNDKINNNEN